jgi:signal transduction histidine kinase
MSVTIRRGLTRRLLIAVGLPLVIAGVSGFLLVRATLLARVDATLLARAEAIASVTTWDAGRLQMDTAPRFMREFDAPEPSPAVDEGGSATAASKLRVTPSVFEVRRDDGEVLARSPSLAQIGMDTPPRTPTRAAPVFWNLTLPSGVAGRALAFVFVPHMPHEGTAPGPIDAILLVAVNRQELDQTLRLLAAVLAGVGLLLAATIALAVSSGLRRELAPLDTLADQASRIDAHSLAIRFPVASLPGELRPIATRLNDLLARLEQSFDRERDFSANVAHELRTPLAELRAAAEIALKWPDARHPDVDRDTLAIAHQMEGIVARLLTLLRSERDQLPLTCESLALASLMRDVWVPFAKRATAKQIALHWRIDEDFEMESDPVLLHSILTNLIENAVDYTPPQGIIELTLDPAIPAAGFCLRIANTIGANTVEALTPDDVTKLFDRFWRHDAARANAEHAGLGLSLARALAHALQYDLTAALAPDGRLLVFSLSGQAVATTTGSPAASQAARPPANSATR